MSNDISSKLKLLRVTGWVLKFVTLLQAKDKDRIIKAEDLKESGSSTFKGSVLRRNIVCKEGTVVYKHQLLFVT